MYSFAAISMLALMSSCKDDDNSPAKKTSSNSFEYDGESYDIAHGYADYTGYGYGYNLWNVTLTSTGITLEDSELTGIGNYVEFNLMTKADDELLPEGKYILTDDESQYIFFNGLIGIDYTLPQYTGDTEIALNSDTVKESEVEVSKSGSEYTIKFSITLKEGDQKISGEFTGELTEW